MTLPIPCPDCASVQVQIRHLGRQSGAAIGAVTERAPHRFK